MIRSMTLSIASIIIMHHPYISHRSSFGL